jgi:hypothetical protein
MNSSGAIGGLRRQSFATRTTHIVRAPPCSYMETKMVRPRTDAPSPPRSCGLAEINGDLLPFGAIGRDAEAAPVEDLRAEPSEFGELGAAETAIGRCGFPAVAVDSGPCFGPLDGLVAAHDGEQGQ